MALMSEVKYETQIKSLDDLNSESILLMLSDVRSNIGNIDASFSDVPLKKVLEVIENGTYEVNGIIAIRVNLKEAKGVTDAYRKYSEGGCQSCVNLGRETIDAQDASSGWYCRVSDPDFDENAIGDRPGVRYSEFSPKISKYFKSPCDDWKPRFSQNLDELIKE